MQRANENLNIKLCDGITFDKFVGLNESVRMIQSLFGSKLFFLLNISWYCYQIVVNEFIFVVNNTNINKSTVMAKEKSPTKDKNKKEPEKNLKEKRAEKKAKRESKR